MNRLVLATRNRHKAAELLSLLAGTDIMILTLDSFPGVRDTVEDRDTLEGNALKKAREAFAATRLPSLADDTGLEVRALNNAPGVFSARYAGEKATYADNCAKLLAALNGVIDRGAQFRCVLAFVAQNACDVVEGICAGTILKTPRGANGFGYDPIFLPEGESLSLAEMTKEHKNTLSHRARALQQMKRVVLDYFTSRGFRS